MNNYNERKPFVIIHKDGDMQNNLAKNLEWLRAPINVSDGSRLDDNTERSTEDILEYLREARDKVWLTRTRPDNDPDIEEVRGRNIERILAAYPDIPENGYTSWQDGYWNGILAALHWILGDDKDFLDT